MEGKKKEDVISNPNHYKLNGLDIEVKDVIKSVLGTVGFLGFYKGNIIKYILRANKKNGLEDYKKAKQYLDWLIEELDEDVNVDGQLTYLEFEDWKKEEQDMNMDGKMKRELTPEEEKEMEYLDKKMISSVLTLTDEEAARYKELVVAKFGTVDEIKEEQRQNRKNFYRLQDKLSKKVTK